jgi:hypothetical protein
MRERELGKVVAEFAALPEADRKPRLPDPTSATPPRRPLPQPPPGGLIIKGYCTYVRSGGEGSLARSREYYYRENPDRWAAETQSDTLWLTEAEARSLIPPDPRPGERQEVARPIQKRLFSTLGIDYMEGSVNSLPPRAMTLSLTVEEVSPTAISLRLDGYARLGKEYDEKLRRQPRSRGCEVRVLGFLACDRASGRFRRFDVVGIGTAWGAKMEYVDREIRVAEHPWMYAIACELADCTRPIDRIPPYNMLHYGEPGKYFEGD